MQLALRKRDLNNKRLCLLSRHLETNSVRQPRRCKSANIVSAGNLKSQTHPKTDYETKLRDLEVVKNVYRDAALATRLKEQRPTCETGHVPPCKAPKRECGTHQTAIWLQGDCMRWADNLEGGYWQARSTEAAGKGVVLEELVELGELGSRAELVAASCAA